MDPTTAPVKTFLLDDQLCLDLYVTSRTMIAAYRQHLEAVNLTYPQYLVMLALWEQDRQSLRQLSERLVLDAGTLSPLLKRLEAGGFVARQRDEHDERTLRVSLTGQGHALKEQIEHVPAAVSCLSGLTVAELQTLKNTLQSVTAHFRAAGAGLAARPGTVEPQDL